MDVEHELVSAVVRDGSTRAVTDAQITAACFVTPDHHRVFKAILEHQAAYGAVPSAAVLSARFPSYTLTVPDQPTVFYIDRLRTLIRTRQLQDGLEHAVDALERGDLDASQDALSSTLSALLAASPRSGHLDMRETGDERLSRYQAFRDNEGLRGVPTGFPTIDRATLGLQSGQLIAIGGLPKGGKTTALVNIGRYAHLDAYNNGVELVPLLYTIEMNALEIGERLDAWRAGVDTHKLRAGELNQAEWLRLERSMQALAKMPSFHIEKGIAQLATVSDIRGRIERHRPDLLLVDGIYLMRDERTGEVGTPQAITSLTQSFKSLADRYEIPTVITSQFLHSKVDRKKRADANSFGYASSFAMDSDVTLALDPTDHDDVKCLKIVASRNCPNVEVYVTWDWASGTFQEAPENPYASAAAGAKQSPW